MIAWYWLLLGIFVGVLVGFGLYHWVLGRAGWLANKAANAVEKRLDKAVKRLLGKEKKKQLTKYERLRLRRKEN